MRDLMERYTAEYLAKFDVVMAHAFEKFTSKQKGAQLPPFTDINNYNRAKDYALGLHKLGLLERMYDRIAKGTV